MHMKKGNWMFRWQGRFVEGATVQKSKQILSTDTSKNAARPPQGSIWFDVAFFSLSSVLLAQFSKIQNFFGRAGGVLCLRKIGQRNSLGVDFRSRRKSNMAATLQRSVVQIRCGEPLCFGHDS